MSLLILCAFLSLVIPAMLLVACVANRLRFLRTCSLIVRTIDPVAAWSIALIFAVFCQTLVPIAAVRGHNFGVPFLPTQLPSLVAWYKQQGVTTGYNGAASFASASSEVFTLAGNWTTTNCTYSFWAKFADLGTRYFLLCDGESGGVNIEKPTNNTIKASVNGETTSISSSAIADANFHHIVTTYDGTNIRLYLDGSLVAGPTATTRGTSGNSAIGGTHNSLFLNGAMDEVKVFSRVWSQAEVTADYASGNGVSAFPGDLAAAGISTSNYVAGYAFNGSGNLVYDYSGNGNTLTASGTPPTYVQGKVLTNNFIAGDGGGVTNTLGNQTTDGAASFAGASPEYLGITSPPAAIANTANSFWVACWANFSDLSADRPLVALGNPGGAALPAFHLERRLATSTLRMAIYDSTTFGNNSANQAYSTTGSWVFVLGWYDSVAATINLLVNNGSVNSAAVTVTPGTSSGPFNIGSWDNGSGAYMSGSMDGVVFGSLPPGGIGGVISAINTALWNGGNGLAAKDLTAAQKTAWGIVSGWDFDGPGNLTKDYIGSNTLTASGTPPTYAAGQVASYIIADGDVVTTWQDQAAPPIKAQGAGNFVTASTQYLNNASNSWITAAPFTLSFWLRCTDHTINRGIFGTDNGVSHGIAIIETTSTKLHINFGSGSLTTATAVTDNTWTHIAITYDGTTCNIYFNGVKDTNSGALGNSGLGSMVSGTIGADLADPAYWQGGIDEFKIFTRVWSTGEIAADYASGVGVSAWPNDLTAAGISLTGYVGGYPFNNSYNLGLDVSGSGNRLTPVNAPTITTGQVKSSTIICGDQTTGNNLTQATAANRPIYRSAANGQNNRPVVQFTAASSMFLAKASFTSTPQPYSTCWMAAMTDDATSTVKSLCDSNNGGFVYKSSTGGQLNNWALYGGTELDDSTSDKTWHCALGILAGASSAVYLDGTSIASGNAGSSAIGATVEMGRQQGSSHYANLSVGEVLVAGANLTAYNAALRAYSKSIWATP